MPRSQDYRSISTADYSQCSTPPRDWSTGKVGANTSHRSCKFSFDEQTHDRDAMFIVRWRIRWELLWDPFPDDVGLPVFIKFFPPSCILPGIGVVYSAFITEIRCITEDKCLKAHTGLFKGNFWTAQVRGSGGWKSPSGVQRRSPGRGSGDEVPRSWSTFSFYIANFDDIFFYLFCAY